MPDPILPDIWKAQCVFQSATGLPEDVFVNSFYFRNDEVAPQSPVGAIKRVLDAFYNAPAANGIAISTRLSPIVLPAWQIRIYDLGTPPPRLRHEQTGVALTRPTGLFATPAELAVALSFYAGRNLPRNRGRVYLGPWASTAQQADPAQTEAKVALDLRTAIADRAKMMAETTENVTWVMVTKGGTRAPLDPPGRRSSRRDGSMTPGTSSAGAGGRPPAGPCGPRRPPPDDLARRRTGGAQRSPGGGAGMAQQARAPERQRTPSWVTSARTSAGVSSETDGPASWSDPTPSWWPSSSGSELEEGTAPCPSCRAIAARARTGLSVVHPALSTCRAGLRTFPPATPPKAQRGRVGPVESG